ncbi:MAG TPA: CotH kinase family protein [Dokdonella sp.]|uniref:CotH kinase family protein n=1 Tax=Dokdonella sp. TaxID=2291710 RepID=UPI0025BBB3E6|nr:CotH kinase family protein [Dokdonella sp.]MBX3692262.1 CotH kinase family protein [Dokdonella sp.]HNR91876.1 CotH kinase family protein [Dokdonella sp.]
MYAIRLAAALIACVGLALPAGARAQDLYDTTTLRTFALTFHDANWLTLLRQNYASETPILATLVVDGVSYPNVGVRIRGNTSYTGLPAGSDKFSLKIYTDHVDPDQKLMGYDNINLNNGFHDPTFMREVVYNNHVAQFIPNPRANHVLVTLNGANWGVYINVQQPNKSMLRRYFENEDGVRIGCSNNPNGPGLAYNGPNASGYTAYEVNNDGGLANPIVEALIPVTNALSNGTLATWPTSIDSLFAIDPSIWSIVFENLLTDDDSYVNKGCDFMTYRDPLDNRLHLIQRDANETFLASTWAINRNFGASNKPVLSRVLSVPELRQRYLSHYRVAKRDLDWSHFEPIITAHRNLIDAAVQADPKRLYSYALFNTNFTSTVTLPYTGPAGGTVVGLQQFVNDRRTFLNNAGNAELNAAGPIISAAQASDETPNPGTAVTITANVVSSGSGISKVELFYRPVRSAPYQRLTMLDNGASGDGAAGDGVYGVILPTTGSPGQRIDWYVAATASNAYSSVEFLPELTERAPNSIVYAFGNSGVRITEWMYAGTSGEFVEFTNLSDSAIDLTGWSFDDNGATPGAFGLGAFGTVQPGESVILTEATEATFRSAWNLSASVKIIGDLGVTSGSNLGRNDQIHLYDATGALQDKLDYGDETYPGSIRTQNRSGQPPCTAVGANEVTQWQLSAAGDSYGSWVATSGELGTPGLYSACTASDLIFEDGFDP